ncbi:MAG: phenylacetate--CoA ligase family protein, partial [Burkholderiales bacterium]|nr:phenylacetate--CoA ligase family protein [Burkholderiales bacterium]
MSEFYDALETRDPAEREGALLSALPRQVAAALPLPAFAERLRGVDAEAVTTRAALATLPVTRKHELLERQQAARAAGGDPFGGFAAIG